ncbi:polysaccharide biosynthesis/export family protein [uncultured Flavobacterium sp.]|uniref:polysaccharide biosynthesis/export family protein n=1 Tax=uncultured Flavobacterium sp. TaxID=165435 RepID=UPI0030ED1A32|tara:strand:- start:54363 stop:55136 length:774 start_codon:yes stop_codon:yes gene_type:complete
MNKVFPIFFILIASLLLGSCSSTEKFSLLQNVASTDSLAKADFQAVLQPDDVLMIIISTDNPIVAQPYNLSAVNVASVSSEIGVMQQRQLNYQIDQEGNIQMPNIGTVKVAGKTRNELVETIKELLVGKITNPVITIRILNYKISVQGEVNRPGSFPINSERVTLLEALSMAGDLTIYGKRDNILVIREQNGVKSFQKVDITKGDFINSPYYYLSQNDVIYVEPNKTRVNSSVIGPNITVGLTAVSLLITILAITIK